MGCGGCFLEGWSLGWGWGGYVFGRVFDFGRFTCSRLGWDLGEACFILLRVWGGVLGGEGRG